MVRLRKGNALFLLFVILSAFLLMAADTPKTDVTVNIEGSNNDLTVELIEKAKQEGTTNLTKEELEELVRLQMKFLSGQESNKGVDVKVETNNPAPTEATPTEKPQETSSSEPVETSDTDTSEQEEQSQSESADEAEEDSDGGWEILVLLGFLIIMLIVFAALSDL